MLTDQELMNIHVHALFTHNTGSRLLFVNEPGGTAAPAPRMFLGRTRAGNVWRVRADVPEMLRGELDGLCADEPPIGIELRESPRHVETYKRLLEKHAHVQALESGPAYHFPQDVMPPARHLLAVTEKNAETLQGGFKELVAEVSTWQPFVALIEGNRAVSVCRSVRITPEAHEAGVETLPDFRGKGYAKDVVAGWAQLVLAAGAMPLYSTSWENVASKALAQKLRLKLYGVDFHIT
ncbi:MAG: GNAT family N-acetyltransferase [Pyrinomonadaceae bacterium]